MYDSDGKKEFFKQTLAWSHLFGPVDCFVTPCRKFFPNAGKIPAHCPKVWKTFFKKTYFSWNAYGHVACCYDEPAEQKSRNGREQMTQGSKMIEKNLSFPEKKILPQKVPVDT